MLITTVAPASTGFGVIAADVITGTEVSSVTFLVTELDSPEESVAVTTMVFSPAASVTVLLNEPLDSTVTVP